MSRKAKPIDLLLKLKQIKPDLQFEGADARAYNEFMDEQAEMALLETIKAQEKKPKKKTAKKKTTKKVKQTIDPEIVETGELKFDEKVDNNTETEVQPEENN